MPFAWLAIACLALALVLAPAPAAAQSPSGFQAEWGVLAKMAGRSAVSSTGTTKARWYWIDPGRVLKLELRRGRDDVLFRQSTFKLGSTPGTLVVTSTPTEMEPEAPYVAHVQADGRVFMQDGTPSPDAGHMVALAEGGDALVYSPARLSGGVVVPNPKDDRNFFHFLFDPPASTDVAQAHAPAQDAAEAAEAAVEHPRGPMAQGLLERMIKGMFAGELPVADVTERVATVFNSKKGPMLPLWLGEPISSRLEQVSEEENAFRFAVEHANGSAAWVIYLADGKDQVDNFRWMPRPPFRVRPIAIGEEVDGYLQHGVPGKYGPGIPVAAFRFTGEQGQRICTRVGSVDAYTHVYLAESLDPASPPLYSSWLPAYTDSASPQAPWNRTQGTSFMATLPTTGEYVLYVLAHAQGTTVTKYTRQSYKQYKRELPTSTKGRYALKLWDADAPEPPSIDDELARTQHPDSGDAVWLGNLRHLLEGPYVSFYTASALKFEHVDGKLFQHQVSLETGKPYPDRVFVATGRRGEYRWARPAGGTLQVQCDGNWTLATGGDVLRWSFHGGNGVAPRYEALRFKGPDLYAHSPVSTSPDYADSWNPLNDKNVAESLEYVEGEREIARENAANRARYAAQEQANNAAMMRGILGGFARGLAEEAADQQYAQEQFEGAVARGQQQGLALRRAQYASDALARMSQPSAQIAPPSDATAGGGASGQGGVPGTGSETSGGASDATQSMATVVFAKGFMNPITPGATSNEMCFARATVGPVAAGDGREGRAKAAAADAEQRFLAACRTLGELSHGNMADEWHVDARAESVYSTWRGNRWMHEVDVD
ncbi:MAG TPA: hypothetical protein VFG18_00900 [Xanthomonadaceae bacterium]|nr:hypothetical protein [Xanthomonadaceae bacterium]